jgi:translation initiation factor eIF-2B subunit delta
LFSLPQQSRLEQSQRVNALPACLSYSLDLIAYRMSSPKPTSPLAQGSPKRASTALPPPSVGLASPKPPAPAAGGGGKVDKNALKAAKAAKRAAAKGLQVGEQATTPVAQQSGPKGGKSAPGGGAPHQATKSTGAAGGAAAAAAGVQASGSKGGGEGAARTGQQAATATDNTDPLQLFLHLDLPSHSSQLSHSSKSSTSNIHPSIIRLALQYSEFKIVGANARCIAMLEALKDVSFARVASRSFLLSAVQQADNPSAQL